MNVKPGHLYMGCPMWSNKGWAPFFFSKRARAKDYLAEYASVFDSVEGNTTFYAVPKAETIRKWADAVPDSFRFTFKFPKRISHELGLLEARGEVERFFEALRPLHPRIGSFFLQLPPHFKDIDRLASFLAQLPRLFRYAVEVRHRDFFDEGPHEHDYLDLLRTMDMDRVIFDTHLLMGLDSDNPDILDAQRRKPKMPPRHHAVSHQPFVRFVGYPQAEDNLSALERWADVVALWLSEGRSPFVFMHQVPDDDGAPDLCRLFHRLVLTRFPSLAPLPSWPAELEPPEPQQLSLF